jgi:hypothetical protein
VYRHRLERTRCLTKGDEAKDQTRDNDVVLRHSYLSLCAGRRVGLFSAPGTRGATCLLDGAAQEELDLPVEAAQIVVRPALDGFQQGSIDTEKKRFPFSHGTY